MKLQATLLVLLLSLAGAASSAAVPVWGDAASRPVDTAPEALTSGQFVWSPKDAPDGPIAVVVSLAEQRAYVYRNGVLIGYSNVSTGKKGHETPTGVFTVLQKDKDHHSSIYNNAAMPFTQRLTWGGVALHAGGLPGYPSSHGCVHLPSAFAQALFDVSPMGMTVVVADAVSAPPEFVHPRELAPLNPNSGADVLAPHLDADQTFRWTPEVSPGGPVSLLLSAADRRLVVLRNGIEIGRSRFTLADPAGPLGTHVFVAATQATANAALTWIAVGVPGREDEAGRELGPSDLARVVLPPAFLQVLLPVLAAGTTLVVTDAAILPTTSGQTLTVVTNQPAQD